MIGIMGIVFVFLPETPWWLCGKSKTEEAAKVLNRYNGHIEGYNANSAIVRAFFYSSHMDADRSPRT